MDDVLISSIDLPPTGNEMWISDADGGLSHLDLREDKSKARRWYLAEQKVGCVSVNPTSPHMLLLSSNDRTAKYVTPLSRHVLTLNNQITQDLGCSKATKHAFRHIG